jgi:hypothetical protein
MGQTRINLKHLLEDIRDGYPFPEEEIIITELVANALDSGASQVKLDTDPPQQTLTVVDNGRGMSPKNLKSYHDIAASTKRRGAGIGFAGIGAKLSLLICGAVVTETRGGRFHQATHWKLESPLKAPWRYQEPHALAPEPSGTAITFHLFSSQSPLLNAAYLQTVIRRHFSPLLHRKFVEAIYRRIYKTDFSFIVNGRKMEAAHGNNLEASFFPIHMGQRRTLAGFGFLSKTTSLQPPEDQGLEVATYGKVIKRGWEWLGIRPKNPEFVTGLVEIPGLSSLLTTNKADFLKDSASLKQYYRYRKAVLKVLDPVLEALGERGAAPGSSAQRNYPSQKEIEQVVAGLVRDFPELTPLLDARRKAIPGAGEGNGGEGMKKNHEVLEPDLENPAPQVDEPEKAEMPVHRAEPKAPKPIEPPNERKISAGLKIIFEIHPEREEMGWLSGTTLCVNQSHPAYKRAVQDRAENYHVAVTAGWVLSKYVEDGKSLQDFLNRFLAGWGREG